MTHRYWFPAKRYGWGWGLPVTWQGWAVLLGFLGLVVAAAYVFPPKISLANYVACVLALSALLVGICWIKGEPPHWRWGAPKP